MSAPVSALITVQYKTSDYTITYIPAQCRDSFNLNIPLNSSKRLVLLQVELYRTKNIRNLHILKHIL